MAISQAFVLAGGKGERLRPLTNSIPKPLVEVAGKPILQYNIELLCRHGVREVVLGTGHLHQKIEEFFGNGKKFGASITYSVEKEPLGTGGALLAAAQMLDSRFFMLNGDNIANFHLTEMGREHIANSALGTIALTAVEDVSGFGVAAVDGKKITEFVEKPQPGKAPGNLVNAGTYVLEKKALEFLPPGFSLIEKTVFPALARRGALFAHIHKGAWFTTDTLERLARAEKGVKGGALGE